MAGAYLLADLGMWLQTVIMIHVAQGSLRDLRRDVFDRLQALSLRFFDRHPHGELMSRLTNDTETISATLADTVTRLIGSGLAVSGSLVAMFLLSWQLALVVLVTLPLTIAISRFIATSARRHYRDRQRDLGELNGLIEETVSGQRAVKVCRREATAIAQFDRANAALRASGHRGGHLRRDDGALDGAGAQPHLRADRRGRRLDGAARLDHHRRRRGLHQLRAQLLPADQRDRDALRRRPVGHRGGRARLRGHGRDAGDRGRPRCTAARRVAGRVVFEDVTFGYDADEPVLRDVSFEASPGRPSRSSARPVRGKTTIINLLTRFYDIDRGRISWTDTTSARCAPMTCARAGHRAAGHIPLRGKRAGEHPLRPPRRHG
jgi:ATP-binding cassette subfamily B multidrug efflux pump